MMLRSHGFSHHFIRAHFAWDPFLHSSSSPSSSPSPSPSPSSSLSSSSAIYIYTPSSVPPKPLPSAIPFTMPATHTHDFCRSSSRRRRPRLLICVKALGSSDRSDGKNGNNGLDGGWDPSFEIEVPADQRPANELAALKEGPLYAWAQLSLVDFGIRLGGIWLLFFVLLGAPIAGASFDPNRDPLRFFLAGGAGALFPVAVLVLRLYLGWSYVGNRLLSAVVPYEETGWYDGQLWVKPPEVLARDRLLGAYQVKPVMNRLKRTLIGAAALLITATASLYLLVPSQDNEYPAVYVKQRSSSGAMAAEAKFELRKEDLLSLPVEIVNDDELAAAAAKAADGRPVYCTDRYYRVLAGGQYCKWEDLRH